MRPAAPRRFPIRTVTTLSLFAATAACSDKSSDDDDDDDGGSGGGGGIVASWGLDTVEIFGKTQDYPVTYSYDGYSYTYGIRMDITSSSSGEWCYYYVYDYGDGAPETSDYCYYDITINELGGAQYQIQAVDFGLDMTCDLSGAFLSCDGAFEGYDYYYGETYSFDVSLDWVRVD